jgi:hypothetical protein
MLHASEAGLKYDGYNRVGNGSVHWKPGSRVAKTLVDESLSTV